LLDVPHLRRFSIPVVSFKIDAVQPWPSSIPKEGMRLYEVGDEPLRWTIARYNQLYEREEGGGEESSRGGRKVRMDVNCYAGAFSQGHYFDELKFEFQS
jgi:hypothetical protein